MCCTKIYVSCQNYFLNELFKKEILIARQTNVFKKKEINVSMK